MVIREIIPSAPGWSLLSSVSRPPHYDVEQWSSTGRGLSGNPLPRLSHVRHHQEQQQQQIDKNDEGTLLLHVSLNSQVSSLIFDVRHSPFVQ